MWEENKLKEQEDITDAAHKAYYKDNRAHNVFCTEHEELAHFLNIKKEKFAEVLRICCCPLEYFFKNCYISDVDLIKTYSQIRDIGIGTKLEE